MLHVLCAKLGHASRAKLAKFAECYRSGDSTLAARSENAPYLWSCEVGRLLRSRRLLVGQSLIESCLVIAILCLLLFGGLQVSYFYMTREVLDYAAGCGARARAVGLNDFMVEKTVQLASLPIAGAIINPTPPTRASMPSLQVGRLWTWALTHNPPVVDPEKYRMRSYLETEWPGQLAPILDSELIYLDRYGKTNDTVNLRQVTDVRPPLIQADKIGIIVNHEAPLNFAFHRAFFEGEIDSFSVTNYIENHAVFYLK